MVTLNLLEITSPPPYACCLVVIPSCLWKGYAPVRETYTLGSPFTHVRGLACGCGLSKYMKRVHFNYLLLCDNRQALFRPLSTWSKHCGPCRRLHGQLGCYCHLRVNIIRHIYLSGLHAGSKCHHYTIILIF